MFAVSVGVVFWFLIESFFFFILVGARGPRLSSHALALLVSLFSSVCGNIYTYLECGNKGEPIVGGCVCNPPVDAVPSSAAVSGCRKFLR